MASSDGSQPTNNRQSLLAYLVAQTEPEGYLVATLNATEAAPYILATQRPVLTFGGFKGSDNVIDVEQLAQMVDSGELRFVLGQGLARDKPELVAWLSAHCTVVTLPGNALPDPASTFGPPGPPDREEFLFDCGNR